MNTVPACPTAPLEDTKSTTPLTDSLIELIYAGNDLAQLARDHAQELFQRDKFQSAERVYMMATRHTAAVEAVKKAVL